jgi:hypothetical protein
MADVNLTVAVEKEDKTVLAIGDDGRKLRAALGLPLDAPASDVLKETKDIVDDETDGNADPEDVKEKGTKAQTTAETAKVSVFDKAMSVLRPKAEMLQEIVQHKSAVEVRDASIASLNSQLSTLNSQLSAANLQLAEMKKLEIAIAELEKRETTVELAAADKIASLGFPASKLPAASSADGDSGAPKTIEEFQQKHAELTSSGKTEEASKFYSNFAQKFGL